MVARSCVYLHLSPRVHVPFVKSKHICSFGAVAAGRCSGAAGAMPSSASPPDPASASGAATAELPANATRDETRASARHREAAFRPSGALSAPSCSVTHEMLQAKSCDRWLRPSPATDDVPNAHPTAAPPPMRFAGLRTHLLVGRRRLPRRSAPAALSRQPLLLLLLRRRPIPVPATPSPATNPKQPRSMGIANQLGVSLLAACRRRGTGNTAAVWSNPTSPPPMLKPEVLAAQMEPLRQIATPHALCALSPPHLVPVPQADLRKSVHELRAAAVDVGVARVRGQQRVAAASPPDTRPWTSSAIVSFFDQGRAIVPAGGQGRLCPACASGRADHVQQPNPKPGLERGQERTALARRGQDRALATCRLAQASVDPVATGAGQRGWETTLVSAASA
eukprot:354859-Chlamydomonas_euryale.AAC.11